MQNTSESIRVIQQYNPHLEVTIVIWCPLMVIHALQI